MIWPISTYKALIWDHQPTVQIRKYLSKSLEYLIFGGILCLVLPEKSNLPKIAKDRPATGPNRSIGILGKGHNQS